MDQNNQQPSNSEQPLPKVRLLQDYIENVINNMSSQEEMIKLKQLVDEFNPTYKVQIKEAFKKKFSFHEQTKLLFIAELPLFIEKIISNNIQQNFIQGLLLFLEQNQTQLNLPYEKYYEHHIEELCYQLDIQLAENFMKIFRLQSKYSPQKMMKFLETQVKVKKDDQILHFIQELKVPKELQIELIKIIDDPEKQYKFVSKLNFDVEQFPKIRNYFEKKFIDYIVREFPWYKGEEFLYGNQKFLEKLVLAYVEEQQFQIAYSIQSRAGLKILQLEQELEVLDNILFLKDQFVPTEFFEQKEVQQKEFLTAEDLELKTEMIHFIDTQDESFEVSWNKIFSSKLIGIDSEVVVAKTKLDQLEIQILQIAIETEVFIFDIQSLIANKTLGLYVKQLLESPNIKKNMQIGHSLSFDIDYIKTYYLNKLNIQLDENMIKLEDLQILSKELFPNEKKGGLSILAQKLLNKKLSKFEQQSNWAYRPLRKAQLHYASLDALVPLKLFHIISQLQEEKGKQLVEKMVQ